MSDRLETVNRILDKVVDMILGRKIPATERLIQQTAQENARCIELTRILEAKRGLEEAKKHNRELESRIKELDGDEQPKKNSRRQKQDEETARTVKTTVRTRL